MAIRAVRFRADCLRRLTTIADVGNLRLRDPRSTSSWDYYALRSLELIGGLKAGKAGKAGSEI